MKYPGIPCGMWMLFRASFQKQLVRTLGYEAAAATSITKSAKAKYKKIIRALPQFEKDDRFLANIVSCAMLGAFVLSMPRRPDAAALADYYEAAMMTAPMRWFCRMSGKNKFTETEKQALKETAAKRHADRNPYSWNMEFYEYKDGSGYEARFTKCGICTLMQELGLFELTPALCRLDYAMSKAGGAADFLRKHTLAAGGPYCDCGYVKKDAAKP